MTEKRKFIILLVLLGLSIGLFYFVNSSYSDVLSNSF
jgi:hypothetical protein